jgi:hypothetical protein
MASVTFDTLKFAKKLESAGITQVQAEAIAEAFSEATSQELVTKSYLDSKLSDLRADIRDTKIDLMKWTTGALIAQAGLVAALVKLI